MIFKNYSLSSESTSGFHIYSPGINLALSDKIGHVLGGVATTI
jgi:hypothetical protein